MPSKAVTISLPGSVADWLRQHQRPNESFAGVARRAIVAAYLADLHPADDTTPANERQPWSPEEDAIILAGGHVKTLARQLGRSQTAITSRRQKLQEMSR